MSAPRVFAETLTAVTPDKYVRFVADWLVHADGLDSTPDLTTAPGGFVPTPLPSPPPGPLAPEQPLTPAPRAAGPCSPRP